MKKRLFAVFTLCTMLLSGCANAKEEIDENIVPEKTPQIEKGIVPDIPQKLKTQENGIPMLSVYQVDEETISSMDIETYLQGVLAGEMKNDWPMEALKAQAILARTFVLKFCEEKESQYEGADISTDIEEAQAYDATGINERIEQAVQETQGQVLSQNGELPYAWFHAHSGGATALAREGLGYRKGEPAYTQVVKGLDSEKAPEEAKEWTAVFSQEEMKAALELCGVEADEIRQVSVAERGESGRAMTLRINDQLVSAPELRIALGSAKMRSTLLTSLKMESDQVYMSGKGYGHGVGMPQWGAYALAEQGKSAEEIVTYYFKNVTVEKVW